MYVCMFFSPGTSACISPNFPSDIIRKISSEADLLILLRTFGNYFRDFLIIEIFQGRIQRLSLDMPPSNCHGNF